MGSLKNYEDTFYGDGLLFLFMGSAGSQVIGPCSGLGHGSSQLGPSRLMSKASALDRQATAEGLDSK
jgi:hypothetical protein